jgi:hypothetical protein
MSHRDLVTFVGDIGTHQGLELIFPGISVDDLDAACKRFEDLGVNWKKRLTDGRMKSVAFVLDPDNYCEFWRNSLTLLRSQKHLLTEI